VQLKQEKTKSLAASRARKLAQPLSPLEKELIEQFGFPLKLTVNKNDMGYFRIPFHDRAHMQTILDKLGCHSIALEPQE
jgi:hypothetical protein